MLMGYNFYDGILFAGLDIYICLVLHLIILYMAMFSF